MVILFLEWQIDQCNEKKLIEKSMDPFFFHFRLRTLLQVTGFFVIFLFSTNQLGKIGQAIFFPPISGFPPIFQEFSTP